MGRWVTKFVCVQGEEGIEGRGRGGKVAIDECVKQLN